MAPDVAVRVGRRVVTIQVERAIIVVLIVVTANIEDYAGRIEVALTRYENIELLTQ